MPATISLNTCLFCPQALCYRLSEITIQGYQVEPTYGSTQNARYFFFSYQSFTIRNRYAYCRQTRQVNLITPHGGKQHAWGKNKSACGYLFILVEDHTNLTFEISSPGVKKEKILFCEFTKTALTLPHRGMTLNTWPHGPSVVAWSRRKPKPSTKTVFWKLKFHSKIPWKTPSGCRSPSLHIACNFAITIAIKIKIVYGWNEEGLKKLNIRR